MPAAQVRSTSASGWRLETTQPDLSRYAVHPWQVGQSWTTVLEKHSHYYYYHLASLVPVQPAVRCLIAGPVHRPICNDDDELDWLLNNVHLNQTWRVVIVVMWILLWYRCSWLLSLPQKKRVSGETFLPVRAPSVHEESFASDQPFLRKVMLAASITWLFAPWLQDKKGGQSEKRGCGWVWETVKLITMA